MSLNAIPINQFNQQLFLDVFQYCQHNLPEVLLRTSLSYGRLRTSRKQQLRHCTPYGIRPLLTASATSKTFRVRSKVPAFAHLALAPNVC